MKFMQVVLDLLQIPFDQKEDVRMNELMRLAHQFLQNFCLSNQNNQVSSSQKAYGYHLGNFQVLLHKHLELFLNPDLLHAKTMCAIFQVLCYLTHFVNSCWKKCRTMLFFAMK